MEDDKNLNQSAVQNPSSEQSLSVAPPAPTPPKPKFKLLILITTIVIFLLLIGSASAAFLFLPKSSQNKQEQANVAISPQTTNQQVTTVPSPSKRLIISSPTPTPDPTANWKTYTSSKFSFKYPPTLYVQEPDKDFFVLTKAANTPTNLAEFSIDARLSNNYSNYTTAVEKTKEGLTNVSTETIPNGIKIKGRVGPGYGEGVPIVIALLKYSQGAISMETNTNPLQEDLFNQILSTFKLTN